MMFCLPEDAKGLSGIYAIRSTVNAKVYVGSAVNLYGRYRKHNSDLMHNRHHSPRLQAFANKYGIASLRFELLLLCAPARLLAWEQRSIDCYNAANRLHGFNILPVAGSSLGTKRTPAQIKTWSAAAKKRMADPVLRDKIRTAATGRIHNAATIAKIKVGNTGKVVSEETRAKMRAARLGRKDSPARIAKRTATTKARHGSLFPRPLQSI